MSLSVRQDDGVCKRMCRQLCQLGVTNSSPPAQVTAVQSAVGSHPDTGNITEEICHKLEMNSGSLSGSIYLEQFI